jgi:Domain of unknown function (DUF4232)
VIGRTGNGVVRASVSIVAALAAVAVSAVALAESSGATPSAAARCVTPGLVVWLAPNAGGAAAGSVFYDLNFTNLARRACTLAGYPGVSAVDLGGRRLGSPAGRNRQQPSRVVTLRAGDTATAVLQISQAANFPSGACHRVTAAGLRVYPPNTFTSKIAPLPFPACSRRGPIYLHVERVR